MRLPIQTGALALFLFIISTTTLPIFNGAHNALTNMASHIKRSPQPPAGNFDMGPLNDDEWDAAIAAWDAAGAGVSDTPISDAMPLAAACC
ncbi:hypothetical protein N7G274_007233 [Stereocaulon virgatum]|uniref:Secreted protein n=1 Tax=Stereocaulon virgatum TaxID=373712 RepID=A0ABR4A1K5_9LECA